MPNCDARKLLERNADSVLTEVVKIIELQREALKSGNQKELMLLDKRLENAFGEKERAFGALTQHKKEHGC
jgi:hypothetical protein